MEPIGSFSGLASGIQWRDMVDQIMEIEQSRRLTPVQDLVARDLSRKTAWNSFSSLVTKFSDAAKQLRDGSAFRAYNASVSKTASGQTLFGATASSAAAAGTYRVEVVQLARAEKLNGAAVASSTAQLGVSGEFWVNGKRVELSATDTLTSVRDRINAVNAGTEPSGVTATILSTGPTSHRLILTADNTGSRGIELVDGDGAANALEQLGILDGTTTRNASLADGSRTDSQRFTSKTTILSTMLGVSPTPAETTVSFGGVKVEVNLATDTLISVMNRVNEAGGSATIVEEVVGGKTLQRLSVEGNVTADAAGTDPAASQRIVELMGFVKGGRTAEIAAGQDAKARIDGFLVGSRINTISDAIAGVTLDLTTANGTERTSSLSGAGLSMVSDPHTIDAGSYDVALTASGLPSQTVTPTADLSVGTAPGGLPLGTYDLALTTTSQRTTTGSIGALVPSQAPGSVAAGTYDVRIDQAATRSTATGVTATTYGGTTNDTMYIVDNATGITGSYSLVDGQTVESIALGLNNLFSEKGMRMTASYTGGRLQLQHDDYGTAGSFSVTNSTSRIEAELGIGDTNGDQYANGVDVSGRINGQAASGSGQTLTSTAGATAGLQVAYTGTTTGNPVGTVTVADTTTTTATVGGQAATWDPVAKTATVNAGGSLAGLSLSYTGGATSGTVGSVTVGSSPTSIASATIGGEEAIWDAATQTIRGAAGSRFEGVELKYTGTATSGTVGTLRVAGSIATDLTVSRDLDKTVANVQKLASAYNEVIKFADGQRESGAALHASAALRSVVTSLKGVILSDVEGISSDDTAYVRSSIAGMAVDKNGLLQVDVAKLKEGLTTNLADIERLFASSGTTSTTELSYIGATDKTKVGTFSVNITQAATKASFTGSAHAAGWSYAATDPVAGDALSVTDAFTGTTRVYTVADGQSMDDTVSGLNAFFANENLRLSAEKVIDGGGNVSLKITGTEYGSEAGFTLSGAAAAGLGLGAGPVTAAGLDVQGSFRIGADSYAATGKGQKLTGDAGSDGEGLQILYKGTGTGSVGTVDFVRGLTGALVKVADPFIRAGDGTITLQTQAIDRSVESLERRIESVQERLDIRREALIKQFARMEEAIAKFNSQGTWLAGQLQQLTNSQMQR